MKWATITSVEGRHVEQDEQTNRQRRRYEDASYGENEPVLVQGPRVSGKRTSMTTTVVIRASYISESRCWVPPRINCVLPDPVIRWTK